VSWWSWQETRRRVWPRLSGRLRGEPPGPRPRREVAPLSRGARGDLVVWAQELLRGAGLATPVSGRFKGRTERAVRTLQRRGGLEVSGTIDDPTWKRLLTAEPEKVRWSRRGNPTGLRAAAAGSAPATASLPPLADEIPPPSERSR
jgi:peptidoglycan hydrolase-like protein with peptidoglycan-binding domain